MSFLKKFADPSPVGNRKPGGCGCGCGGKGGCAPTPPAPAGQRILGYVPDAATIQQDPASRRITQGFLNYGTATVPNSNLRGSVTTYWRGDTAPGAAVPVILAPREARDVPPVQTAFFRPPPFGE